MGSREDCSPAANRRVCGARARRPTPIARAIPLRRPCRVAVVWSLANDAEVQRSIKEVVSSIFE